MRYCIGLARDLSPSKILRPNFLASKSAYLNEKEVMDKVHVVLSGDSYNKKKRPQNGTDALTITTSVYIHAINAIDQNDFSYEVTLHLR